MSKHCFPSHFSSCTSSFMRKGTIASSSSSGGMKVVVTGVLIMSSKSSKTVVENLDFRRLLLIDQGLIITFMDCVGPLVFSSSCLGWGWLAPPAKVKGQREGRHPVPLLPLFLNLLAFFVLLFLFLVLFFFKGSLLRISGKEHETKLRHGCG